MAPHGLGRRTSAALGAAFLWADLVFAEEGADSRTGTCRKDTYGLVTTKFSKPFTRGVEDLKCNFTYTDAANIPKFVLNYYPSLPTFASYNGTDMVPERHEEYSRPELYNGLKRWRPGENGPKDARERIQLASCEIPQADGSTISIERVGPLVSYGNYDYWQYGWEDVWGLSRHLEKHPEGLMFQSSFSGAVDVDGKVLGHPPIHIHHIHVTPSPGVVTKMAGHLCNIGVDPRQCYAARLAVEQHGDYQCTEEDGGIDCLFEKTAEGHAKVVSTPFDLEGEINDVRAPDSEPLVWWYQVVLHWFPKTEELKPLSQHFNVGPGQWNASDQRHNVLVFPVPTKERSVYWYSGAMHTEGELVRNKLHAHNTMFDRAFWFAATPAELGLDDPKFFPDISYDTLLLKDLGFPDFEALQGFLLGNLASAAGRFDRSCPPSRPGCADRRPALICESWVSNEDFLDPRSGVVFAYDRRAPCCCRPWSFEKGTVFTVVAFMAPMKTPPGPWSPRYVPPKANMHIHWLMTYTTPDNQSHYGVTVYTQRPDKQVYFPSDTNYFPIWSGIEGVVATPGSSGYNNKPLTISQWIQVAIGWFTVSMFVFWEELKALSVFICAVLVLGCFHCLRAKRAQDHPLVQCATNLPCHPEAMAQAATECVGLTGAASHGD